MRLNIRPLFLMVLVLLMAAAIMERSCPAVVWCLTVVCGVKVMFVLKGNAFAPWCHHLMTVLYCSIWVVERVGHISRVFGFLRCIATAHYLRKLGVIEWALSARAALLGRRL